MSHILHPGHQPTDIAGITGPLSTVAGGFDPALDVNAIRHVGFNTHAAPFSFGIPEPAGDLWLRFRYVPPNGDANIINRFDANFLEVLDASNVLLAQIKPLTSTSRYHAIAHGGTSVQGSSACTAPNGQPQWIDVRIAVGTQITIEFPVEGVLMSAATAANTTGKGKSRLVVFANTALHGISSSRTWYYAHIAALDGLSTIGRRFVRRTPNTLASFNQMAGSIDALRDGDIATRVASTAPSFAAWPSVFSQTVIAPHRLQGAASSVMTPLDIRVGTDSPLAWCAAPRLNGRCVGSASCAVASTPLVPSFMSKTHSRQSCGKSYRGHESSSVRI